MAEPKTQKTKASVAAYLDSIPDAAQRKDAKQLAALMRKATGKAPAMWGTSIVGFGEMKYEGKSGRSGEWFRVGLAARKAALTVYLMAGLKAHSALLKRLGRHTLGGGCLYLPRLADIDVAVLTQLVSKSYKLNTGVTP